MKKAIVPLLLALTACSSGEESPAPAPSPDTFDIRKVDLWREQPVDICRSVDPDFLSKLTDRVRSGVDPKFWPSFSFEDFSVRDADGEGRRVAAFRFKIDRGAGPEMMTAVGQIDPKTCAIGEMKLGVGPHEAMFGDADTVTIEGA
ncbi:hypothetical protein [Erythrobacter sp. CCH5-A1]|uniref:hypothetical protein n=1 Tax=Erythrobacter sp. CCH5-A1 TaxID=1768792 RepID=UPI00083283E1|nr:hypothetical protein [Erythrobacter sp. CCH5-A1]